MKKVPVIPEMYEQDDPPIMLAPDKGQAAVMKVESGSAPCGESQPLEG